MVKYYNIEKFTERIYDCNNIICIGIGQRFTKMINLFHTAGISRKICVLADNNPDLIGTTFALENRMVEIVSLRNLANYIKPNSIIIIACTSYYEIIKQLEEYFDLNAIEIICFSHIYALISENNSLAKKIPNNLKFDGNMLIPKTIHYCWFGGNQIPSKYKKWMESWHKYCPDYEIIEWNESNYDIKKNKYMYQAYKAGKWGFVPDYARLDIIYNYGGIYLDTDVEIVRNLDHLLFQKGFAGFESNQHVALGLGFGAQKGHPLIKEMIDQYDKLSFINENGELNLTASPVLQTQILLRHGLKQNGEYQTVADINIYPEKMFCAKSMASRLIRCADYTCSIHHYDASWQTDSFRYQNDIFEKEMNEYYGYLASDSAISAHEETEVLQSMYPYL